MKATKFTVEIKIEVLSNDTIEGMLCEVRKKLAYGIHSGKQLADDGDSLE